MELNYTWKDFGYTISGEVDKNEAYRSSPATYAYGYFYDKRDTRTLTWNPFLRTRSDYTSGQRLAFYHNTNSNGDYIETFDSNVFDLYGDWIDSASTPTTRAYNIFPIEFSISPDVLTMEFYSGVPIFETQALATSYVEAATDEEALTILKQALNYKNREELDEETIYEVTTIARNYTVDAYGNKTENTASGEVYRGFRIKSKYKASLYKKELEGGILKYGIKFHDAIACYYSTDYGKTWLMVAGAPATLPFDFTYRPYEEADGTGITFWAAVGDISSNMLEFDDEADADDYNSGDSDGRKASNYNQIMSGSFDNPTGNEDEETDFGEVKTRGFFTQQYVMDSTCLQALANDLFDVTPGGIWEDIKKGLDM